MRSSGWMAAAALAMVLTGAVPAVADDPEPVIAFSARNILLGEQVTISGHLLGGAADSGRQVQLYQRQAPFPGDWAVLQTGTTGADGSYGFSIVPPRKAYFSIVAPATATAGRQASRGYLVSVRRKVSIKVSDRTPRKNEVVRFSGFISPSYPLGPSSVATLQRRDKSGGFTSLRAVLLKSAGAYSSFRIRAHVQTGGVYRVYVPGSTFLSAGASVGVTVRLHG